MFYTYAKGFRTRGNAMIYADNAATTRVSDEAIEAMSRFWQDNFGNPNAMHAAGQRASAAVMDAPRRVAACLGCTPRQIVFTSCGTESDNQALMSLALRDKGTRRANERDATGTAKYGRLPFHPTDSRNRVITFQFEHAAVLQSVERLKGYGFDVDVLPVGPDGIVDVDDLAQRLGDDVACVAMMMVNNEVGTVQPVKRVARMCKERGIVFHCDAVQAAGHIPIRVNEWGIDTLAISAHKFHGPKGVGVLVHQPNDFVEPLIVGGGQERGLRSGTSNTPGIVGCAIALEQSCESMKEETAKEWSIWDALYAGLSTIPDSRLSGTPDRTQRVPGIIHFCFKDVDAQTLLIHLDEHGICASAGSACMAGALRRSGTLQSMGIPDEWARGALRLSFDSSITIEDARRICDVVAEGVAMQRAAKLS